MEAIELENKIQELLSELTPTQFELIDESHQHIGHRGVLERGGRHYSLIISSPKFEKLNLVQSHQLIYELLQDLMKKEIHALKIKIK